MARSDAPSNVRLPAMVVFPSTSRSPRQFTSVKVEPFRAISLQVKNKHTVQESLKYYVKGEMLEGDNAYYCEKCEKKVNTLMRCCIKRMPNILFLVLKRFEFDFETMQKIKVNDYCEFPTELDMSPYSQQELARQDLIKMMEEKNLTKEGLMVGALGVESNPYSAAANVVADVAVAEGVPGASYVQSGLAAASVVGLATTIGEGMFAAATLPEVAAAAAVPLAVAGGIGAAQYGVKELDESLFGSSANAPAPAFNTVSRAYLPPKPSSQDPCQSGERRLTGGECTATSSGYGVDWTSQPDAPTEDTPTEDTPTPGTSTLPSVYDDHQQLGTQRTESVADAPPLGYFIYDASQDFHGQVVVF